MEEVQRLLQLNPSSRRVPSTVGTVGSPGHDLARDASGLVAPEDGSGQVAAPTRGRKSDGTRKTTRPSRM